MAWQIPAGEAVPVLFSNFMIQAYCISISSLAWGAIVLSEHIIVIWYGPACANFHKMGYERPRSVCWQWHCDHNANCWSVIGDKTLCCKSNLADIASCSITARHVHIHELRSHMPLVHLCTSALCCGLPSIHPMQVIMASYIQEILAAQDRFSNDKVHLFVEKYWHWSFYISIFYVMTIFLLQAWMEKREKFDLRRPLFAWSTMLAVFSVCGFWMNGELQCNGCALSVSS